MNKKTFDSLHFIQKNMIAHEQYKPQNYYLHWFVVVILLRGIEKRDRICWLKDWGIKVTL